MSNEHKFYKLSHELAARRDINPSDKILLSILHYRMNNRGVCWPGLLSLIRDSGLTRPTVISSLQRLKKTDLIGIITQGDGRVNIYHLPVITSKDSLLVYHENRSNSFTTQKPEPVKKFDCNQSKNLTGTGKDSLPEKTEEEKRHICKDELIITPLRADTKTVPESSTVVNEGKTKTVPESGRHRTGKQYASVLESSTRSERVYSEVCDEPIFLTYALKTKDKSWNLLESKVREYETTYPNLDVRGELRKACQWVTDNSAKRKTAKGMLKFLSGWLGRAKPVKPPDNYGLGATRELTEEEADVMFKKMGIGVPKL